MTSTSKRLAVIAVALALLAAMVCWGILAHRGSPRWRPGETFTASQAQVVLRESLTGLRSAAVMVQVSGRTDVNLEGAVALTTPRVRAALRLTNGGTPQKAVVRIIGERAWVQATPDADWSAINLRERATGPKRTVISQIAAGIDLPRLFTKANLDVRSMKFKAQVTQSWAGTQVTATVLTFRVNARAVRQLLPRRVTQRGTSPTRVPAAVWLDNQGRLLRFETQLGDEAVAVTITGRNPDVRVTAPRGIRS